MSGRPHNLQYLRIDHTSNNQLVELLEHNVIGTPGRSMLYQHTDIPKKLADLPGPTFFSLYLKQIIAGTICFSRRRLISAGIPHTAYYIRYFTFREKFRSANRGGRSNKNSLIRDDVKKIMSGTGFPSEKDEPLRLYAYVDEDNIRSFRLTEEFGFKEAGKFKVITYSRVFPRFSSNLHLVDTAGNDRLLDIIRREYAGHYFVPLDNLFERGNYYVLIENGQWICGLKAVPDEWKIIDLPGFAGKIMMKLAPKLPWVNRLFSSRYRFLFFDFIFCSPGKEHRLQELFNGVLAKLGLNSAFLCLDPDSAHYKIVEKLNLGLTHRIMGEKEISVLIKTTDSRFNEIKGPFFVSGYDVL